MQDTKSLRETIARRVRVALVEQDVKATELARRMGWTQARLNRRLTSAEYGAPFTAAELAEVAAELGVPVSKLYPEQTPETVA